MSEYELINKEGLRRNLKENLISALIKGRENQVSTYISLELKSSKRISYQIKQNRGSFLMIPVFYSEDILIYSSIEEVVESINLSNFSAIYIVNVKDIADLSKFWLETQRGLSEVLKKDSKINHYQAVSLIALAAANLGRDIEVCGLTFKPSRDYDFDNLIKVKGVGFSDFESPYELFDHINETLF